MQLEEVIAALKKGDINTAYPCLVALSLSKKKAAGMEGRNDAVSSALRTYADIYLDAFLEETSVCQVAEQIEVVGELDSGVAPRYDNALYTGPDPKMSLEEYKKLASLCNLFKDQRIFIMGNGPSLNEIDLELIKNDHIFCLNRISLLLDRVSWTPEFYAAFDLTVVPDNLDEFNGLDIPYKFFATKHKGAILEKDQHYWYHDNSKPGNLEDRFDFSAAIKGFGGGGTVTTLAIQLAYYMGFDPIILIGCDASYTVPKTVEQSGPDKFNDGTKLFLQSTRDDDQNHFDPRYFGKGKKWHNPNVAEMHRGFENCYKALKKRSRTMVNATRGGALECVPRCNYDNLVLSSSLTKNRIRVGVDLTQPIANKATGMRNYLFRAINNINLFDLDIVIYLICTADNCDVFGKWKPKRAEVIVDTDDALNKIMKTLDCIHHPFNSIETELPILENTKRVVSIHDLIPIMQPGFSDSVKKVYIEAAKVADAIICLSEPTREMVAKQFGFSLSKCFVSPPYVGDELAIEEVVASVDGCTVKDNISKVKQKYRLRFPYVLYPATYRPHKNHDVLINAMRYVYSNLHLVLTTGENHDPLRADTLVNKVQKMGLMHRVHVLGHVSVEDFYNLYRGAVAVVFPSLDEGFGIPVSEAQSLSIPVLASRCGSLSDVAKGSLEIDPIDLRDIADKINTIHSDEVVRAKCIREGLINVKRFTKEAGAKGLLDAYYCVCSE